MTHDAHADTADHEHHYGAGHGHGHSHGGRGGKIGAALREVFAPHSHDASDSIDGALESSAAGIRAVKISLLALGPRRLLQTRASRRGNRLSRTQHPLPRSVRPGDQARSYSR